MLFHFTNRFKKAFYGCSGLKELKIPMRNIPYMAFAGCTGLTSLNLYSVDIIGKKAFFRCTGLTSIEIPESVEEIEEGAFALCSGLKSVSFPNRYEHTMKIAKNAFEGCSSELNITIREKINISDF